MADIIENVEVDRDIVDKETLDLQFNKHYKLKTETAVSLQKSYITTLHGNKSHYFAVGLSDNSIEVHKLTDTSLSNICKIRGHGSTVTEVVFSPQDTNMLYSAGEDGIVKLWDTRTTGVCVSIYKDESDTKVRPYTCLDISCNGRVLCAGSQLVKEDAYLVFWDQRHVKPLGGYWNSHTDDITQVKFHKSKSEILVTGSLDGLVNVFNIMEQMEDDALLYSLNVENSVERLSWLSSEQIGCITQSNDVQLWNTVTGDLIKNIDRDTVSRKIKRSKGDDCYLVDTYSDKNNVPTLLAGSYGGEGNCLRSVLLSEKKLVPSADFGDNKQIVRCTWYDEEEDMLATAGESGLLSVWSPCIESQPEPCTLPTPKQKNHLARHKPY